MYMQVVKSRHSVRVKIAIGIYRQAVLEKLTFNVLFGVLICTAKIYGQSNACTFWPSEPFLNNEPILLNLSTFTRGELGIIGSNELFRDVNGVGNIVVDFGAAYAGQIRLEPVDNYVICYNVTIPVKRWGYALVTLNNVALPHHFHPAFLGAPACC